MELKSPQILTFLKVRKPSIGEFPCDMFIIRYLFGAHVCDAASHLLNHKSQITSSRTRHVTISGTECHIQLRMPGAAETEFVLRNNFFICRSEVVYNVWHDGLSWEFSYAKLCFSPLAYSRMSWIFVVPITTAPVLDYLFLLCDCDGKTLKRMSGIVNVRECIAWERV